MAAHAVRVVQQQDSASKPTDSASARARASDLSEHGTDPSYPFTVVVKFVRVVTRQIVDSSKFREAIYCGDDADTLAAKLELETLRPDHPRGRRACAAMLDAWRDLAAALNILVPEPAPRCAYIDCVAPASSALLACATSRQVLCALALCDCY